eukprot:GILI01004214.1.p1 GENE.GILI01004214.1~~GILI01004214.1.p1  ORF type:complete len:361 (+),score=66.93 GILI01004214.1:43-1083(+)
MMHRVVDLYHKSRNVSGVQTVLSRLVDYSSSASRASNVEILVYFLLSRGQAQKALDVLSKNASLFSSDKQQASFQLASGISSLLSNSASAAAQHLEKAHSLAQTSSSTLIAGSALHNAAVCISFGEAGIFFNTSGISSFTPSSPSSSSPATPSPDTAASVSLTADDLSKVRDNLLQALLQFERFHSNNPTLAEVPEGSEVSAEGALSLRVLGEVYLRQKNTNEASAYLKRCLKVYEKVNDQSGLSRTLALLASLYHLMGQPILSEGLFRRSIELAEKHSEDNKFNLALALDGYCHLLDQWENRRRESHKIREQYVSALTSLQGLPHLLPLVSVPDWSKLLHKSGNQ